MGAISFDNALGIHPQALSLRAQRAEIIANNLANSETPNFKARDIDFKAMLQGATGSQQMQMQVKTAQTNSKHLNMSQSFSNELLYRTPVEPSIDGNSVNEQMEQVRYTRNSLEFNSSFQFLNSKFKGLLSAIKGQ